MGGEGGSQKSTYREDCLKRGGAWTIYRFKVGWVNKRVGVCLREGERAWGEGFITQCTLCLALRNCQEMSVSVSRTYS